MAGRSKSGGVVLYDSMSVLGGAEKVTELMLQRLAPAELLTGFLDPKRFPGFGRDSALLGYRSSEDRSPGLTSLELTWAFTRSRRDLMGYRWAIFSGIHAPLAVRQRPHGHNILYCHAIPRFCFDLRQYYRSSLSPMLRPVFDAYVALFLALYRRALSHMDRVIANSENVRRRLATHCNISATVVHPPVAVNRFRWLANGDDYVSLARLEPLKRVDKIIQAFQRMPDRRLVVASGGSEEPRLKRLADGYPNIRFTGWLAEPALADLVGQMRAAIYVPVNEDFGMSPVEAMAAGKPVIGVAEGGLLESVLPNETGVLIGGELTPEAICDAVTELHRMGPASMRDACEARAALFSEEVFVAKMRDVVGLNEPTRGRPLQCSPAVRLT